MPAAPSSSSSNGVEEGGRVGDRSVQTFSQISQMANGGGFLLEVYEDGDRRFDQQQGHARRWE